MVERRLDTVAFSGDRQNVAIHAPSTAALFALGPAGFWVRRRQA
jgi:hypothetical protein